MKKLGLSTSQLFAIGIAEHDVTLFDLSSEIIRNELLQRKPDELQVEQRLAKEEALIFAFAKMIESNNDELLKQLKSAGVLPDL